MSSPELIPILSQIGSQITQLGHNSELRPLLHAIADSIVKTCNDPADTSAVIWVYYETEQIFNPLWRVAAGEPPDLTISDVPRPNGVGLRAIGRRQRVLSYQERALPLHPQQQGLGVKLTACYPLLIGPKIVGLLYVHRRALTPYHETELMAFDHFAHLTALAIRHGHYAEQSPPDLTQRVTELEKLWFITQRINSRATLTATLQEILSISLDLLGAQYGSFELYDKKRHVLKMAALAGYQLSKTAQFDLPINEQSIVGWVATHKQPLRIGDLTASVWQHRYHPLPVDRPMRSELAVPLIGAGGGLEGVLNLESPQAQAFSAQDQHLLETLATQAVVALQEIRLLDSLHEIFKILLTAKPADLFQLILDCACDLINVPAGSVWLITQDTLVVQLSTAGYAPGDTLAFMGSLTEQAIRAQHPISVDNLRLDRRFAQRQMILAQGWISLIVVPLLLPDNVGPALGSFSFFSRELRDFSSWDKRVLTCLANHAAVAIQYAKQLSQLRQAQERQALTETLAAVGDVAANLLHQLNNKIGAIPAQIQAIEAKAHPTDPYLTQKLHDIESSARQALTIVRDSMAHLRPTERQAVDLAQCLGRALQRATPPPTLTLIQQGLTALPRVMANEQQLEMVFYNLIDNALKAMPKRRAQLTLSGEVTAQAVIITVSDNGKGVSPELQARLFEFRPTPAQAQAGRLGFGLWWVKTFVERFGGQVSVKSRLGRGSSFTVYLPLDP